MCLFFHDWTRWSDFKRIKQVTTVIDPKTNKEKLYGMFESWQHRRCLDCGKKQWELNGKPNWIEEIMQ